MIRIVIAALVAAALAGCASDPRGRRGTPPQDPPDYQGVPTDMTPPSMLGEPGAGGGIATPAK
ncbi:hypothetical protein [Burkholderia thailandensis]|uniref:Lipoprotein, putative n=1 Tax=Burkholderia thailandensis (strain ATCC 700388 / DSM 13276 / CCUG 48851 / CIP 106301 / E264) TaxID=271848 RepID=Q2SUY0_BURTA|nr:hypothetical protein [Burkholderia thailandensis]ABC37592.1 lipoprotein, putative [Burkholderia thailandensis E264]AHI72197.1 putative lipoprotein [Burkholderia thailandensis 2002721723]AHI79666.1 putative lipoprotein [Burkholderia thailandensis E444]AIP26124.1 putative lipoprotein [Burkholderia thailandensis E264]AIS95988.1 putative lipoprotein [Burkholderia thailandensis MSMB59]